MLACRCIDLTNGQVIESNSVKSTGLPAIAGITFDATGTLYAVSGQGQMSCPGCRYALDKTSGAPTFLKQLDPGQLLWPTRSVAQTPNDGLESTTRPAFRGDPSVTNRIHSYSTFAVTRSSGFTDEYRMSSSASVSTRRAAPSSEQTSTTQFGQST